MDETTEITQEKEVVTTVDDKNDVVEEKTYTKEEFDSMFNEKVQERLSKKDKSILDRYGVASYEDLDTKLSKLGETSAKNKELTQKMILRDNNISATRFDDVKAIFKGKGLEFSNEELITQIATHPEWIANESNNKETVVKVGVVKQDSKEEESDRQRASKLLGVNLR